MRNIGIVIFDGVEELDAVGPYEILATAAAERRSFGSVFTVAERPGPVICAKAMQIIPKHCFDDAPPLDVLMVPGGMGTRAQSSNPQMLDYVRREAARCEWITSVCSGIRVLLGAGVAVGKRVTTHWSVIDELKECGLAAEVVEGVRFVRDGNLVSSAGISAGIDMALWLTGTLAGDPGFARLVQRETEYFPAPPFAYEA